MASAVPPMIRICSSAPVAAPLVSPMMSGLPNGLRVRAWNAAPDAPRAAPMVTAHSARASRRSSTTKFGGAGALSGQRGDHVTGGQREVTEKRRQGDGREHRDRQPDGGHAADAG